MWTTTGEIPQSLETVNIYPAKHIRYTPKTDWKAPSPLSEELKHDSTSLNRPGPSCCKPSGWSSARLRPGDAQEWLLATGLRTYAANLAGASGNSAGCLHRTTSDGNLAAVVDESHVTCPSARHVHANQDPQEVLIDTASLPSAAEQPAAQGRGNSGKKAHQDDLRLATQPPGRLEQRCCQVAPAGDPFRRACSIQVWQVRPSAGQVDDLLGRSGSAERQRTLLCSNHPHQRIAEDLTDYLPRMGCESPLFALGDPLDRSGLKSFSRFSAMRLFDALIVSTCLARRPRPAGGFSGGHSRCGQGRIPAGRRPLLDDRPGRPPCGCRALPYATPHGTRWPKPSPNGTGAGHPAKHITETHGSPPLGGQAGRQLRSSPLFS